MGKVYKISPRKNPLVDADHDAYCLPFDGKDLIGAHMMGIRDFQVPGRLYLLADFLSIPVYDFIDIDLTFHVISVKMLKVLNNSGNFKYSVVPVTMIDDSFLDDPFDKNGELKGNVPVNNGYVALQLKEYLEVFDYEKSTYQPDLVFPEEVGRIVDMVLKSPQLGFPPLFKIKEALPFLFVSEAAKEQLEKNKIAGCCFEEVQCTENEML